MLALYMMVQCKSFTFDRAGALEQLVMNTSSEHKFLKYLHLQSTKVSHADYETMMIVTCTLILQ